MRVLLVDDEVRMVGALARGLVADGFAVDVVHDGPAALQACAGSSYDAVVLDIMLPGLSGYEVLKRLRARADPTPVLMLTARDAIEDRVRGLESGADDYLVKPFAYVVLVARLHALARRGREQVPATLRAGAIALDPARRTVTVAGDGVELTPREFRLLEHLLRRNGVVVSKLELLERVFDADPDTHPNIVEVYVGYLRRKLGRDSIVTVRGGGYRVAGG